MMLHNFLADSGGIHFEAATCEPMSRRPQSRGHSCVRTCTLTCSISRPPPFLDQIPNPTPPSPSFLPTPAFSYLFPYSVRIVNSIPAAASVFSQLLGSPLYLPQYRLKNYANALL